MERIEICTHGLFRDTYCRICDEGMSQEQVNKLFACPKIELTEQVKDAIESIGNTLNKDNSFYTFCGGHIPSVRSAFVTMNVPLKNTKLSSVEAYKYLAQHIHQATCKASEVKQLAGLFDSADHAACYEMGVL